MSEKKRGRERGMKPEKREGEGQREAEEESNNDREKRTEENKRHSSPVSVSTIQK